MAAALTRTTLQKWTILQRDRISVSTQSFSKRSNTAIYSESNENFSPQVITYDLIESAASLFLIPTRDNSCN